MLLSSPGTPLSLLDRVCGGDHDAWRHLLAIYEPLLHYWLRRSSLQPSDRDDLTQQILTVLVRKLPAFRHNGRTGAFRHWLRQVTLNELGDFGRRRGALPQLPGGAAFDELPAPLDELTRTWDEEYDRQVLLGLLNLVKDEFAPRTWEAFRRVALDGACPRDVAAEVGLTVNAVALGKTRVLRRLRQEARGLIA